ncbi:MAG: helix-turn-helix domain-containing protein [Thermomicrobiales bacterium]
MVAQVVAEQERRTRAMRHESVQGAWELVLGEPEPRLREYVVAYHGYVERMVRPVCGWELPSVEIPCIINFGPAYRLRNATNPDTWATHNSFVAGLHDVAAYHEAAGLAHCLQVNFTPIGAYRFFGVAMGELVNRVVALDDVFGPLARLLEERLYEASSWDIRFAILDGFIAERIDAARPAAAGVAWAWRQIEEAGGCVAVNALAEEIGWSRKHLATRFREQVGMPPKHVARILRFHRAVRLLDRDGAVCWADLAHRRGYYDQSHLIRDVRQYAGCTPTELLGSRLDASIPAAFLNHRGHR